MIWAWALVIILCIMDIVFLSGHGSRFISGYNMMGPKEKETIDERKYSIGTGVQLLFITIPMGLFVLYLQFGQVQRDDIFILVPTMMLTLYIILVIIIGNMFLENYSTISAEDSTQEENT